MPFYLSHSDMSTFRACREKWNFSSSNRMSLRHKKTPALYLTEGSGFHEAIEAGVYNRDPYKATMDYLLAERQKVMDVFKAETGHLPWASEMTDFDASMELTMGIVRQYFEHYGLEDSLRDQGLTYIAAEIPFKIPISLPEVDPGNVLDVYYVGTFDGLALDENENLWVVENKTYQAKPDVEDLQYHSQCNGYAVAFEMLTGIRLTGTLYNGVAKQLIKKPKVLSNGLVSTDMRQLVTVQSYLDGLREHGQDPFDPRFTKILTHLQERERQGDSRFFHREKIFFNQAQVESWYDDLMVVAAEMVSDPAIYRTVPYNGCGPRGQGCWFRDLCHTKHDGGDVQALLDARYMTGSYGTIESMQMETHVVSSVPELKEFLRSLKADVSEH